METPAIQETPTILIAEDDQRIAALVAKNLCAAGFLCHCVHRGDEVLAAHEEHHPNLLILDISLPGIDGLEVMRGIRARADQLPILMLTARSSEGDKVLGFELGADDYVTKPFSTGELVARVRALLRRTSGGEAAPEAEMMRRGELEIDPARRIVRNDGKLVELTSLEFDLLHFLANRPGWVYSREALMDQVWGDGRVVDERSIDSLVSRLRRKLEPDLAQPIYVQTVWGAGYRFGEDSS